MTDKEFLQQVYANKNVIHKACNIYYKEASREDMVQEIILELYKSLETFKNNCSFKSWIFAIARNTCINVLRKEKKLRIDYGLDDYVDVLDEDNSEEMIEQLQNAMRYNTVIDSLNENDKKIFNMYFNGMSYAEMEQQTGINENRLRVTVHRIKNKLKLRYGGYKNN